jgi:hypothetical protein
MPIFFTHDGKRLDIDDIPLDEYAKIQTETGLQWWQVTPNPMAHAKAGAMLAEAAARVLEVELPATLTPRLLVEMFKIEANGEPNIATEFTDGIPDPKAGDEPATT